MKRKISLLFIIVLLIGLGIYFYNTKGNKNDDLIINPYTQEYVSGQGNIKGDVDIEKYKSISEKFDIGADENGYAVFKDPYRAFYEFEVLYSKGIEAIEKEFHLKPMTKDRFQVYKTYGWQITKSTYEEQKQARFVTRFLDIYENSFTEREWRNKFSFLRHLWIVYQNTFKGINPKVDLVIIFKIITMFVGGITIIESERMKNEFNWKKSSWF